MREKVRESLKTTIEVEANRRAVLRERELQDEALRPAPVEERDTPLSKFWEPFAERRREDGRRPRTIEADSLWYRKFQEWVPTDLAKPLTLRGVTPEHATAFRRYLVSQGLGHQSINTAIRTMRTIYDLAEKYGMLSGTPNPFKGIEAYRIGARPPKFMTVEQRDTLLETARTLREGTIKANGLKVAKARARDAELIVALGCLAGFRRSEISAARWEWFDFTTNTITLQGYENFELKDKDARTLPMADKLRETLVPHKQAAGFVFSQAAEPGVYERYAFDFKKLFATVAKDAGLDWTTPHVMRYTFGSILAQKGISLYKIARWMGHSDTQTTRLYAHLQAHDHDINVL